jgi:hypothetical protein
MAEEISMSSANVPNKPKVSLAPVKALSAQPAEDSTRAAAPMGNAKPAPATAANEASPVKTDVLAKGAIPAKAPVIAKPEVAKPVVAKPATREKAFSKPVAAVSSMVATPAAAPAFSAMGEALLRQQLVAARHLGGLQKVALDHAVSGLMAGCDEFEELTRTTSLSDAMLIQAKAFRRGQDAMMAFITELGRSARP